jgi:hypothetical protein
LNWIELSLMRFITQYLNGLKSTFIYLIWIAFTIVSYWSWLIVVFISLAREQSTQCWYFTITFINFIWIATAIEENWNSHVQMSESQRISSCHYSDLCV